MEKLCKRCEKSKKTSEFNKLSKSKDGLNSWCRSCQKEYKKSRKKEVSVIVKTCNKCGHERKAESFSKSKTSKDGLNSWCKSCISKYSKKHYEENKEILKPIRKEWKSKNKEKLKDYYKNRYNEIDKDRLKEYYENNKEEIIEKRSAYRKTDEYKKWRIEYLLKNNWKNAYRDTLRNVFKRINKKKKGKTIDILGYSAEEFKIHIENLFEENMSWEDRDSFHIDHIIPISSFKEDTPINIINSLENLQPLKPNENLEKNNSIPEDRTDLLLKYERYLKS